MEKIRTQVQLERQQYLKIKAFARRKNISFSQALREFLDMGFDKDKQTTQTDKKSLMKIAGIGKDIEGKKDVARNHNKYLYG